MTISSLLKESTLSLPVLSTTNELGCLQVSGVDAIKFLQGQTSCDFAALTETQSLFGAICNVKGRVITNFYAVLKDNNIILIMSSDLLTLTLNHLTKYSVFFKTDMHDMSDRYQLNYIFSEDAITTELENTDGYFTTTYLSNHTLVKLSSSPLFHYLALAERTHSINDFLGELATDKTLQIKETSGLSGLAILSGQPFVSTATSEKFIPQMLNMQLTEGVNFKKGCYTGQEIVARMQYRGNLKKRAYLFSFQLTDSTSWSIEPLTKFTNAEGRDVAEVVCSTTLFDRTFCLAVIGDTDADQPVFFAEKELQKETLPYTTPKTE